MMGVYGRHMSLCVYGVIVAPALCEVLGLAAFARLSGVGSEEAERAQALRSYRAYE